MLQSFFIHIHPTSSIHHWAILENIRWAHRWGNMKHFILQKKAIRFLSLFPYPHKSSPYLRYPHIIQWLQETLRHQCLGQPHPVQDLSCSHGRWWWHHYPFPWLMDDITTYSLDRQCFPIQRVSGPFGGREGEIQGTRLTPIFRENLWCFCDYKLRGIILQLLSPWHSAINLQDQPHKENLLG